MDPKTSSDAEALLVAVEDKREFRNVPQRKSSI
jgi:hypothetical protein